MSLDLLCDRDVVRLRKKEQGIIHLAIDFNPTIYPLVLVREERKSIYNSCVIQQPSSILKLLENTARVVPVGDRPQFDQIVLTIARKDLLSIIGIIHEPKGEVCVVPYR